MKYIKEYKEIEWEDIDFEEEEPINSKDVVKELYDNIPDSLAEFLIEERALYEFVSTYIKFNYISKLYPQGGSSWKASKKPSRFFNRCPVRSYIVDAFPWDESFNWNNLDRKWTTHYDHNIRMPY